MASNYDDKWSAEGFQYLPYRSLPSSEADLDFILNRTGIPSLRALPMCLDSARAE